MLLVAPQPFFRAAGTPINVRHMCNALSDLGFEVHLVTLPLGEDIQVPNLVYHRVVRLPVANIPIGFSLGKLAYNVTLLIAVLRLLLRHRFVVVHAIEEAAFYSVPIARLFHTPAIADLDSDLCQQLRDHRSAIVRALAWPAGLLRKAALRQATCALTVARPLTELVRAQSPGTPVFEIRDIPLTETLRAPETNRVESLRSELGLAAHRVVTYTGNFDGRQGVELLVRAMPAVIAKFPEAALLLVGGDPDKIEHMSRIATELGIGESVRFARQQPPETMPEFMTLSEVLVSPRLEPLITPLKIYTYMASGQPIVATDLPTHTQVLDARSAILVPPNAEGLAAGIIEALADPARAASLGRAARRKVHDTYNYDSFKRQMAELYSHATKGSHVATQGRRARDRS